MVTFLFRICMPRTKQKQRTLLQGRYDNVRLFDDQLFLTSLAGRWKRDVFGADDPLVIEIGCGEGAFLHSLISYHEKEEYSYSYIGIEIKEERLWKAVQKNEQHLASGSLAFVHADARNLSDFFAKSEIDGIYLNFSDPWPKDRHAKNRLTHPDFLKIYKHFLKPGGFVSLKTDDSFFYTYSLETFVNEGFVLEVVTDRIESVVCPERYCETEFEVKWRRAEKPIHYIRARFGES